jgi:hypothetical protein
MQSSIASDLRPSARWAVRLPLSSDDCRELKATIDVVNNEATELLKAKPGDYTTSLYGGRRGENDGGRRLIIVADAMASSKFQQLIYPRAKPEPQSAASYQKTIAALRSRAIPIDDQLTRKEIIDEFTAKRP